MSKPIPAISLNCIVKNESKVIARMLKSVAPFVDYYVIVDTGSTDNTKEIIKSTMDELGVPGEIHDHEWVDFCTARNFALKCVKGKATYGFWIDADEQLMLDERFNRSKMLANFDQIQADIISTKVHYGGQKYFRSQLFRIDIEWEWRGAVHEIMFPPEGYTPKSGMVEGLYSLVTPDGASWGDGSKETQKKKYLEHAKLLEEYIKKDKDVRWVFYLAQSYRDAFEWDKAVHWYKKRIQLGGGYWEELYYSQLMVATCKANTGKAKTSEVLHEYTECSRFDKNRAEHYLPVIRHWQSIKNYPVSYMYTKYCIENHKKSPFPKSTLFINNSVYDWEVLDLHCVNAYWMGKFDEAKTTYNKLRKAINNGLVSPQHVQRILDNEKWYTKQHIDTMKKTSK